MLGALTEEEEEEEILPVGVREIPEFRTMLPLAMTPLALLAAKTGQVVPEARNDHQAEATPMTKNHRVVPHTRNDHQAAIAITVTKSHRVVPTATNDHFIPTTITKTHRVVPQLRNDHTSPTTK